MRVAGSLSSSMTLWWVHAHGYGICTCFKSSGVANNHVAGATAPPGYATVHYNGTYFGIDAHRVGLSVGLKAGPALRFVLSMEQS